LDQAAQEGSMAQMKSSLGGIPVETVDPGEMLESAFRRLQSCECHTVPVVHGGKLVGLVTMDNVGEFVAIQAAMESGKLRTG
jgi:predicted transcriptional regulator